MILTSAKPKPLMVGVTRYSVLHPGSNEWVFSKSGINSDSYKTKLFDENRLNLRWYIFSRLSIPILKEFSNANNYLHIIQYSPELPLEHINNLKKLELDNPFVVLDEVKESNARYNNIYENIIPRWLRGMRPSNKATPITFGLFNLDDDDLLSVNWMDRVQRFVRDENVGLFVSLGLGVSAMLDHSTFRFFNPRVVYLPYINIGQVKIASFDPLQNKYTIPNTTDHMAIDRNAPVISYSKEINYFWIRSVGQDTGGNLDSESELKKINRDLDQHKQIEPGYLEEIALDFPTCKGLIVPNSFSEAISIVNIPVDIDSNPIIYEVDILREHGDNISIAYSIECDLGARPNSALISFEFESEKPVDQALPALLLSPNKSIGHFMYLSTKSGLNEGTVSISACGKVRFTKISLRRWNTDIKIKVLGLDVLLS